MPKIPLSRIRSFDFSSGPPSKKLFWIIFIILLVFNFDRLLDPPYWDALTGVYAQGAWLKHNHFDYVKLFHSPDYWHGGPKVHLFYILAPAFSALLLVFSPASIFFAFHVTTLILVAALMVVAISVISEKNPGQLSLLWVTAALVSPIWSGQTAAIYLEIPFAFFSFLSFYYFGRKNTGLAVTFCIVAYFFKSAALLQSVAYGTYFLFQRDKQRSYLLLVPLLIILILESFSKYGLHISPTPFHQAKITFLTLLKIAPALCCMSLIWAGTVIWAISGSIRRPIFTPLSVILSIFIGGFWISFLIYPVPLIRYTTIVHFPLVCVLGLLLSPYRKISGGVACFFVAWGLINQTGKILKPLPLKNGRDGHYLERSREFLIDLDANRRLCHYLEKNHFNEHIVCKAPFSLMLTVPELGYVENALPHVYQAGTFRYTSNALNISENTALLFDPSTLFVYASNIYEFSEPPSLAPRTNVYPLFQDESLPGYLMVYRCQLINRT